jgi:DNA polymerase III sliding clamp (beta) subunit (PCNA family)
MKFSIEKTELLKGYNLAKLAVETRSTRPILQTIYFKAYGTNSLMLKGTNLNALMVVNLLCEVEERGEVCMGLTPFEVLKKFDDGPITFELKDYKLKLSQGKRKHNITYADPMEFPQIKMEVEPEYRTYDPRQFVSIIDKVSAALATDTSREIFTGYCVDDDIMTSDGYRGSVIKNVAFGETSTILPSGIINPIFSYIREADSLDISFGKHCFIKATKDNLNWEYTFSPIEGEYPKTSLLAFVEKSKELTEKTTIKIKVNDIKKVLDMINTYYREANGNHPVDFEVENNQFSISLSIPDRVEMKESIDGEVVGDDCVFNLAPGYFGQAIQKLQGETCQITYYKETDFPVFLTDEVESFVYFQMPMRFNK